MYVYAIPWYEYPVHSYLPWYFCFSKMSRPVALVLVPPSFLKVIRRTFGPGRSGCSRSLEHGTTVGTLLAAHGSLYEYIVTILKQYSTLPPRNRPAFALRAAQMHAKPARAYRHDGCTTSALHTMHADSVMRPAPTACCFPTGGMQSATTPRTVQRGK
jgi:hypothetical protein